MRTHLARDHLTLLALFAVTRGLLHAAGVRFYDQDVARMMHFADVDLLRSDLVQTLWLMDGQPPGFNLLLGLALKCGASSGAVLRGVFLLTGWALAAGVLELLRRRGVRSLVAVPAALLFAVQPAAVLFENYVFYTYPVAALLVWLVVAFGHACAARTARSWLVFWLLFAALCWLRNLFQLGTGLALLGAVACSRTHRRAVLVGAAAPLLLVASVHAKNFALYGSFGSSCWLGVSLTSLTTYRLTDDERAARVLDGRSSAVILAPRFADIPSMRLALQGDAPPPELHPLRARERKLGGDVNYHHAVYSAAARKMATDAAAILRDHPDRYLRGVLGAYLCFCSPASTWPPLRPVRRPIERLTTGVESATHAAVGGQRPGVVALLLPLAFLLCAARSVRTLRGRGDPAACLSAWIVCYVTLACVLLEAGENNRMRFCVDALIWVEVVAFAARRGGSRGVRPRLT